MLAGLARAIAWKKCGQVEGKLDEMVEQSFDSIRPK
jgi:hypothetical protein